MLVPCLVYPYKEPGEAQIHSVEDNKFSVRPNTLFLDTAERLSQDQPTGETLRKRYEKFLGFLKKAEEKEKRKRIKELIRGEKIPCRSCFLETRGKQEALESELGVRFLELYRAIPKGKVIQCPNCYRFFKKTKTGKVRYCDPQGRIEEPRAFYGSHF